MVELVAGDVDDEEAVAVVVLGGEAVDRHLVGAVDAHAVLARRLLALRAVEDDLRRVLGIADELEVALGRPEHRHALAISAALDLDRVAGLRLVDGRLDGPVLAAVLAHGERVERALRRLLGRRGLRRRRILAGQRGGWQRQGGHHGEADDADLRHANVPPAIPQGSTRYQPAIPPSWWVKTWQWYSQRPGLSSMKRAVIVSLGPTAGVSTNVPLGSFQRCPWM